MSFLSATPADQLVKPVSPQELNRRSLVQILSNCDSRVLAQLGKGQMVTIGASQPGVNIRPDIDLREHYDAANLARVSIIHGSVAFLPDGNVVYGDLNSVFGSVVERTQAGVMAPQLYFQMLHDTILAYLVTNRVSNAAEPFAAAGMIVPPFGLSLKSKDLVSLGFNYQLVRPSGLAKVVSGSSPKLQAPNEVMVNGQLAVPRLAVYVR